MTYDIDPANLVKLTWSPQEDGAGRLTVRAVSAGFAGDSTAWFDTDAVAAFAASIVKYPLSRRVTLASGFGKDSAHLDQEHVRLDVYAVGGKGQVAVGVHLSTEVWPDSRPESLHEVRLELLTTYERLQTFASEIKALLSAQTVEASIGGESLV